MDVGSQSELILREVRIGIAHNLKNDFQLLPGSSLPEDVCEEFDLPETVEAIQGVLSSGGHEVSLLGGDLRVVEKIKRAKIDFVFNLAEGFYGRNREAHIPALLELLGIPYSGSDPLGLSVTLDKSVAKRIAISLGIPTPEYCVLSRHCESAGGGRSNLASEEIASATLGMPPRNDELKFPLFVKPLWQGSSKGIRMSSRVEDRAGLERETNRLFENYPGEPVLVEEYIPGRELTVGLLGNGSPEVLGVMEISFRDPGKEDFCYSLEVKRNWREQVEYHFPARLDPSVEKKVQEAALSLFETLGLRDVARFDFRVTPSGKFYFLEANPLPGLSPESGDLVILARKKGWSYRELILKITHSAWSRYPGLNGH